MNWSFYGHFVELDRRRQCQAMHARHMNVEAMKRAALNRDFARKRRMEDPLFDELLAHAVNVQSALTAWRTTLKVEKDGG